MKKKLIIIVAITVSLGLLIRLSHVHDYLTFEHLKENRYLLQRFVSDHYPLSVAVFMTFHISTAFFVPAALILTIAGGFLFGVFLGALYVNLGALIGAVLAFLASRFLIGNWVQKRYRRQLKRFNQEIDKHGANYLFVLRIVPMLPFFITNYAAGITKIPLKKFMIASVLGTLPGSLVYAFAGHELSSIDRPEDILSTKLLIAFLLFALFSVLPAIRGFIMKRRRRVRHIS